MPTIIKPNIKVTYNSEDVISLVQKNIFDLYGFDVSKNDIKPNYSGGYKTCDCDLWGGPSDCNHLPIEKKFEGYTIEVKSE